MGILDATSLSQRDPAEGEGILGVTSLNPQNEAAHARLQNSANANPDQAAQSVRIGQDLDVDPRAVDMDFKTFDDVHRTSAASTVVGEDPALTGYILSHPLAASVSKDDWLNLGDFTKAAGKIANHSMLDKGMNAFMKSLHEAPPIGSWMKPDEAMEYDRFGGWKLLGLPIELGARLFSAGLAGVHASLSEAEKTFGLQDGFANTITGMLEYHLIAPGGAVHDIHAAPKPQLDPAKIAEFRNTVGPYAEAGEVPPVGLHPITDAIHVEQAKIDAQNLKEALAAATKTDTRERSPELFADHLAKQVVGEQKVGINSQAILELYGDKVPEPGDGILGWVPNLAEQLKAGGDVEVPVKDLLARIEPKVFNQISDFIRSRPDGMTLAEAKEMGEPIASSSAPQPQKLVDDLRSAISMRGNEEPAVKLELQGEVGGEGQHGFRIVDQEGKQIADLILAEEDGGKRLYVDDISATDANGVAPAKLEDAMNTLGPAAIRDVLEQIKEQFPNAETIEGVRVSGAREKAIQDKGSDQPSQKASLDLKKVKPRQRAKQLEFPDATRMEDRKPFAEAPIGFTKELYERYLKAIQKLQKEDAEALRKWAMDDARRQETKEWKAARAEMKKDVAAEIESDPAQRLDDMIRAGATIRTEGLTPEQIAAIPEKNRSEFKQRGATLDQLAQSLGVSSGDTLINHYMALVAERGDAKPLAFREAKINAETDRRMQGEMGDLGKRIIERAMDRILSETQEELLHQETMRLAIEAGQQYEISRQALKAQLKADFEELPISSISSKKFFNEAVRAAKQGEQALLKADPAEGFRQAQARENAFLKARMAADYEKARTQFDRRAKQFRDREVDSIPAEFTNAIHAILQKLELPVRRTANDLRREMEGTGFTDLADFLTKKEAEYATEGIEFPVPDFLLDARFSKALGDLSLRDFNGVKQAVDSLYHFGRDVQKVEVAGAKFDREELVGRLKDQLRANFPVIDVPISRRKTEGARELAKTALAASTGLETVFYRFDHRDPNGLFTKTFTYPGAEAANYKARLDREFGAELKKLGPVKDGEKLLTPPFADPHTGRPLQNFRRKNLAAIISNVGNDYNWRILTKGWNVEPAVLWDWIIKNSTKEDFDRAYELSKVFDKAKDMSDVVYRNLYGVAPESIEVRPFVAHGKTYPGWYHPIIRDPSRSKLSLLQTNDPLKQPQSFWPSTPNSYTKRRTGAVDVLDLTYDMVPIKLNQMIHDVAMRSFVYNSAKVIRDRGFRQAVTERYGKEYVEEMDKWLERAAGSASWNSDAMAKWARASNFVRQNVVTTHIAFAATTVQKHAATAAVMSGRELGPNTLVGAANLTKLTAEIGGNYLYHAVSDLFGKDPYLGNTLAKFIHETSEEIQRRERHWQETIYDTHNLLEGKTNIRQQVAYWGAKAVAFSDKVSAMPLWLGVYRKVLDETGDHGMAVNQANFSVRRAHGSTAVTSLPRIATGGGILEPWMTTLYGFMGANMQRRLEIAHDISDAYSLGRSGEIKAAMKKVPGIVDSVMANVVWVGLIEEIVTHQFTDDKRSLLERALPFALGTMAQTVIGLRDFAWALTHGHEPQVGLLSSAGQELTNVIRDMKKPHPLSKANAGKFVEDAIAAFGDVTGMGPKPVGRAIHYGMDVYNRQQRPKSAADVYRGIVSGRQQKRVDK